jgi:hypothetical protein
MMGAQTSGRFDAVKTPTGWVYALRPEDHGPTAWFGLPTILIGAGTIMLAAMDPWMLDSMVPGLRWRTASSVLAVLTPIVAGSAILIILLQRCIGRDELRLDAGAILALRRLGPLSWSKTVQRSKVAQLTVVRRSVFEDAGRVRRPEYYALVAEDETGRRRTLVGNYPREMLLALAIELSSRWKALAIDPDLVGVGAGKPAVGEDSEIPTDIRERFHPPRGTRLILERAGSRGVRITIPPYRLSGIGLVLALFLGAALLLGGFALAMPPIMGRSDVSQEWVVGAGLLVLFGACFLAAAAFPTTRERVLIATPDALTLEAKESGGTSCKTWKTPEIASICVEPKLVCSSDGERIKTRVLIRPSDLAASWPRGPTFVVARAEADALVELLRKPRGAPASAFVVVASRKGPGPISDHGPIAEDMYDYAARQKTRAGGLSPRSPILRGTFVPEQDELVSDAMDFLSKAELEWIATTLRVALGVPAHDR